MKVKLSKSRGFFEWLFTWFLFFNVKDVICSESLNVTLNKDTIHAQLHIFGRYVRSNVSHEFSAGLQTAPSDDNNSELQTKTHLEPNEMLNNSRAASVCSVYRNITEHKLWKFVLTDHVIGGEIVPPGEEPHVVIMVPYNDSGVALGYKPRDKTKQYEYFCAGSIISKTFVLTAAHCCTGDAVPLVVLAGTIDISRNTADDSSREVNISQIIVHPEYVKQKAYHDIALLRLSEVLSFNEMLHPACLHRNTADIDQTTLLAVAGWGAYKFEYFKKINSDFLRKTNVTSMSLHICNRTLYRYARARARLIANENRLESGLSLGQMCAFDPQAEHDTCEGDSGGPIEIDHRDEGLYGFATIVGITSFGVECASKYPSVYTRVAYYLDWIEPIVWPLDQRIPLI